MVSARSLSTQLFFFFFISFTLELYFVVFHVSFAASQTILLLLSSRFVPDNNKKGDGPQMQTPQAEPVRFSDLLTRGYSQVMWQVRIKTKNHSSDGEQIRNRHAGLRNERQPKM